MLVVTYSENSELKKLVIFGSENLELNRQPRLYCPELNKLALRQESYARIAKHKPRSMDIYEQLIDGAKHVDRHTFIFFTTEGNLLKLPDHE